MFNIEERNLELYKAYIRVCRTRNVSHNEAIRIAVNSPCSRYWISPDYVYREILAKINPNSSHIRCKPRVGKKSIYDQMFEEYKRLSKTPMFRGCSIFFISSFLVNRPAPNFCISYSRAKKIIERLRKQHSKKIKNNYGK